MVNWCGAEEIVKRYGELDGELHMVKLRVDPSANLGLDLAGNSHLDKMSVFVAGIHPDSPVARDGRIHVGDELLEVQLCRIQLFGFIIVIISVIVVIIVNSLPLAVLLLLTRV